MDAFAPMAYLWLMFGDDVLDTDLAKTLLDEKGLKLRWVIKEIGLPRHSGYELFRLGLLPKNPARRKAVLGKLARIVSREPSQLVLRLEKPRRKSA